MNRALTIAKGLAALGILVALVVGIPWALWHFVGWPLPHEVPSWSRVTTALEQHGISDRVLFDSLACVVWVCWAILSASVLAEVPAAARGRAAPRLPIAGALQPLVGHLAAAVLVAGLAAMPRPMSGSGHTPLAAELSAVRPRQSVVTLALASDTTPVAAPLSNGTEPPAVSPAASTSYVVQRGDTLWGIAEHQLGDPLRWQEIYQLNEGRPQPDGRALTDPHWIYPGWTLVLPSDDLAPPPAAPTADRTATPPTPTAAPSEATTPTVPPRAAGSSAETLTCTPPRGPTSSSPGHRSESTVAVRLPSGSVIAGSFASGVLAALAAGRVRRRLRYRAQSPLSERAEVHDAPSGGVRDLLLAVRATRHDEDEELGSALVSEQSPMTAIPDGDALVHPDVIEVGSRSDEVVRLGFCAWPGLVLSGPGATDVLRAWAAAFLARNGPYGVEILVVGPLGDRLFPGIELPSLHRVETAEAALSRLERAMVARSKRLDGTGATDAVAHRRVSPEDPLPLLLVVTDVVPESLDGRWRAMLDSATRLGLAALVLIPEHAMDDVSGPSPRVAIGEDGSVRRVAPQSFADVLGGSRLFQLSTLDAVDLLAPIAAIHVEEFDDPETPGDPDDSGAVPDVHANGARPSATSSAGSLSWPAAGPETQPGPIRVDLFGTAHVEAWGETIASGLRSSAYELLAWYALHPHGATAEAAIEALWPDTPPKRGRERFWNALGNLRSRLHGPNEDGVEILTKIGQLYHPDPSVLDIDLWRFESALNQAAQARTPEDLIVALRRASACYGGDFYPTGDALWVEPVREGLHRRALDTQIRLAELYVETDQGDTAIAALERAIELDSICEDAYRRLITLQSHVGREDAAKRTWVLLQGRLAELDLEPEATTSALAHELLGRRPAWAGRPPTATSD